MIQVCTHNSRNKIKLGSKLSEPFQTVSGLRQGCILSPILFSLAMEKKTRTILNRPEGMNISNNVIKDFSYADDIDLIAPSLEDLDRLANDLKGMASRIGLSINENKTKLMKITKGK